MEPATTGSGLYRIYFASKKVRSLIMKKKKKKKEHKIVSSLPVWLFSWKHQENADGSPLLVNIPSVLIRIRRAPAGTCWLTPEPSCRVTPQRRGGGEGRDVGGVNEDLRSQTFREHQTCRSLRSTSLTSLTFLSCHQEQLLFLSPGPDERI